MDSSSLSNASLIYGGYLILQGEIWVFYIYLFIISCSSFYGSFGNGKEDQLLYVIMLFMFSHVMVSLVILLLIAWLLGSCAIGSDIHNLCIVKVVMFGIVGRQDFGEGDLRDKLDRRQSPRRIYSPTRDARGRNTFRGRKHSYDSCHFSFYCYLSCNLC